MRCARESLRQNEFRECRAVAVEQFADVDRRNAMAQSNGADRESRLDNICEDIGLERIEPRGRKITPARHLRGIARRADHERDEIINVRRRQVPQLRSRQSVDVLQGLGIAHEQPQRCGVPRNRLTQAGIGVGHHRSERAARHAEAGVPRSRRKHAMAGVRTRQQDRLAFRDIGFAVALAMIAPARQRHVEHEVVAVDLTTGTPDME
jgi:hypothetical protein